MVLGTILACFSFGVHSVNKAPCISCLRGRGRPWWSGAHYDEDLPLVEEDLFPHPHLGLPQGCSRLKIRAVLGGEGHKSGEVGVRRYEVGRGKNRGGGGGGSGGVRVGELIAGILTGHNHGIMVHGVNKCQGVRHAVL